MKNIMKVSLWAILGLCLCTNVWAQDTTARKKDTLNINKYKPFDVNLQVRNLYIWRGFRISDSPIADADLHYTTRDGKLAIGFWGGESFEGSYKEFDYYISYKTSGFNFSIWDINNFSNYPNANLFNYNRASTSHFIDVTAGYQFGKSFPLNINWSTIVQGRDTYTKSDGQLGNAYSNYVILDYPIWKRGHQTYIFLVPAGLPLVTRKTFMAPSPT